MSVVALTLGAVGCLGPDVEPATDVDTGTTRALIQIDSVSNGAEPQATALAGFARIPASSDAEAVLNLLGWDLDLPPVGTCAPQTGESDPKATDAPIDRVEFLEAGEVVILAGSQKATLAPRAFPTVSDAISGVVYTTRDASADPLPPNVAYEVHATGGISLPPLLVSGQAPSQLSALRLGGVPIGEVTTVVASAPLDVTWDVGTPGDLVAIELALDNGGATVCSFLDEAGTATIPAGTVDRTGPGWLVLHRVRVIPIETPEIDRGELRFDLEREVNVTYTR